MLNVNITGHVTRLLHVHVDHRRAVKGALNSQVKIQFNPQKMATKGFSTDSSRD